MIRNISIPLWGYWNIKNQKRDFSSKSISIPLWGYWNKKIDGYYVFDLKKFQSHSGAIGTLKLERECLKDILISIPLWGYWNLLMRKNTQKTDNFQSYSGAIGTRRCWRSCRCSYLISVPLWGYWNWRWLFNMLAGKLHFNPTLGLLEQKNERDFEIFKVNFQSHSGAIGTFLSKGLKLF